MSLTRNLARKPLAKACAEWDTSAILDHCESLAKEAGIYANTDRAQSLYVKIGGWTFPLAVEGHSRLGKNAFSLRHGRDGYSARAAAKLRIRIDEKLSPKSLKEALVKYVEENRAAWEAEAAAERAYKARRDEISQLGFDPDLVLGWRQFEFDDLDKIRILKILMKEAPELLEKFRPESEPESEEVSREGLRQPRPEQPGRPRDGRASPRPGQEDPGRPQRRQRERGAARAPRSCEGCPL